MNMNNTKIINTVVFMDYQNSEAMIKTSFYLIDFYYESLFLLTETLLEKNETSSYEEMWD